MISVIVPIYNIEEYVGECIESILCQSYRELEIILVDDGSTDRSGAICDAYAEKDSRIKVIHKRNGGLVSARKAGLEAACGEYISYVDGDDWIDSHMYQKLLALERKVDVIAFAAYEEYGRSRFRGIKKNMVREGFYEYRTERYELYSRMMVDQNFYESGVLPYLWAKLIRRKLILEFQRNVPDSVSYAEDVACIYPCLLKAQSVYVSNMPLYHYRIRPGSMVKAEVGRDMLFPVFQTLWNSFLEHHMQENLKQQLRYFMQHTVLLKGYRQMEHSMTLFPFEKVKKGMRIAIYGAGMFGRNIRDYCKLNRNLTVVAWFDQRYEVYVEQGLDVQSPRWILDAFFDVVVIAVVNIRIARQIKEELVQKGIHPDQIDYMSMKKVEAMQLPDYMEQILEQGTANLQEDIIIY